MAPLVVALPKGRMQDDALGLFRAIGYSVDERRIGRRLIFEDESGALRFILAKPTDVPIYVEYGAADLGVVGEDTLRESSRSVYEPLALGFARCHLALAGPPSARERNMRLESSVRVASKYPNLARQYFEGLGISAEVIPLSGSVELGPAVGLADLLVDLVESGRTLRENGLVELETIMESQAVLIVNHASHKMRFAVIQDLVSRLAEELDRRAAAAAEGVE
ncbi:MAG: ATP phosphoribosyltransferase [Chloroflexi bacterium]|nr:ATP phosphoribosyltransferase [Chloroflexota bacterium]